MIVFVLCDNATLLLQSKTFIREEKPFPGLFTQAIPTWQQVPLALVKGNWGKVFTKSWSKEKARVSQYIRYLLKVLFLFWDYPKAWFCFTYILKKCGVGGF